MRKDLHEENRLTWNEATVAHNSHKGDQVAFFALVVAPSTRKSGSCWATSRGSRSSICSAMQGRIH